MQQRCTECGFEGGHRLGCKRYPTRERPGDDLEPRSTLSSIRRHKATALGIARGFYRRLPRSVPREDLEQAALIGLWEWKRNHPDEETPGWIGGLRVRIRGAVIDELRHQDWLPRAHNGKRVDARVVAWDDVDLEWEKHYAGSSENPEEALYLKSAHAEAWRAPLIPRDAQVIDLLFRRGMNQREVGDALGLSAPRVCQIQDRAIATMRAQIDGDERVLQPARRALRRSKALVSKRPSGIYPAIEEGHQDVTSTLPEEGIDLKAELARYQDWMVEQALIRSGGNRAKAARMLRIERTTLVELLKRDGRLLPASKGTRAPLKPLAKCGPKEEP